MEFENRYNKVQESKYMPKHIRAYATQQQSQPFQKLKKAIDSKLHLRISDLKWREEIGKFMVED